ncbi:MAG: SDR family oxidoreductase [Rhodothermales bacterium]|nr:SDR family oxidoreductase [Rhodothermales bacterium]
MRVLVTGATGYIGGRLIPLLLNEGHEVRVLVRDPGRLAGKPWAKDVAVCSGDLSDVDDARESLQNIDVAYYLVHSMCSSSNFADRDRHIAATFTQAAKLEGVAQIIYLGGILPVAEPGELSEHLLSRAEVGQLLASETPTTELRAGPIIGSGSASFEMVRYLTERLPAMIAPKWITHEVQPIAVRDILSYLVAALGRDDSLGIVNVGCETLPFREMMLGYAAERGLPRLIVPVPVLAPGLAALWVGLVTPIPNCMAVPLVEGMIQPVVANLERSRALYPEIEPLSYRSAVAAALTRIEHQAVQTRWSDALGAEEDFRLEDRQGLVREVRTYLVDATSEEVFRSFSSLGGDRGWLVYNWAWRARGFIDQLVGGPGLRRGRRDPETLRVGDALDFWRVEEVDEPRLLRLRAEMKVPGRAWLQFETRKEGEKTLLIQAAMFRPRGFSGWAYWYGIYPFHALIFRAMVRAVGKLAES